MIVLWLLMLCTWGGGADVVLLQKTVVDDQGLDFGKGDQTRFSARINGSTFQQYPLSSLNGYQYTTYYNAYRHVCVGRRELPGGAWDILELKDYAFKGSDAHDVTSLGICAADGTIHLAFDHHGKRLNYRVSALNTATDPQNVTWETSLFSRVTDRLGTIGVITSVTYPRFVSVPNGNLLLYYRNGGSGSGDGMIQEYDGTSHTWNPTGRGKFISRSGTYHGILSSNSKSRNPYLNAISFGGDRLHVSWVWRENAGSSQNNHDLCYAYSDDYGLTWYNNAGDLVSRTGEEYIRVDTPGITVASIPQGEGLINQTTHYAYPDGTCHVVLRHYWVGTTQQRYHHYWCDTNGQWRSKMLPVSTGSRPKLVGDDDKTLYLVYTTAGDIRIAKGVPNQRQTDWTWSDVYSQEDARAGGEGLVDLDRWQQERILSVYDQAESADTPNYGSGSPVDAEPAPLHVWDYQVSSRAILPVPAHAMTDVSPLTDLQWQAGLNAISHQVYLGTDWWRVAIATPDSLEYQGQQRKTDFQAAAYLNPVTRYYWRVDEMLPDGSRVQGTVWDFTTANERPRR